ncbi:uncharacterized protein [Amphiura filiformis]|uniref:uncharacterized protein n=1 Tax=Amphiura filiformis TaxID=82378 RepID=UPI003B20CF79
MGEGRSSRDDGGSVFVLLCILVLIVGIVAAAGMVMAVLNYNRNSDAPININVEGSGSGGRDSSESYESKFGGNQEAYYSENRVTDLHYDSRIWNIRVTDYGNRMAYVDRRTRQFRGYLIDVINAVCQLAGRNCEIIDDDGLNCWNNDFPQVGLMGKWYDACTAYSVTEARLRSMKFTKAFKPAARPAFLTSPGNPLGFDMNNLSVAKIGFLAGWWANPSCITSVLDIELDSNQVFVYNDQSALRRALQDGEVDAICISNELAPATDGSLQVVEELDACLLGGDSLMMRKDSLLDK